MAVYLIAWPDHSWSVLVCEGTRTVEELCEIRGPLDFTGDPACASIFQVRKERSEFYCEFDADCRTPRNAFPLIHSGDLIPVRLAEPYSDPAFQSLAGMLDDDAEVSDD